jgi:hypothetical protein
MTPPSSRPTADDAWGEDAGQIPRVPGAVSAAERSNTPLTGVEAIYGPGPVRAALMSTIHDAGCHYCGDGHGSGPTMDKALIGRLADAVLAADYRPVGDDETTAWTIARTLAFVDGFDITRPDPGEDPTPTAWHFLALARAAVDTLRGSITMTDATDNLAKLIERAEELDHAAAGLSEDVVAAIGDTEESVRVCGEARVAIHKLAELLEDAREPKQP